MAKPSQEGSSYLRGPADEVTGLESTPAAPSTSELAQLRRELAELRAAVDAGEAERSRIRRELEENQALVHRLLGEGKPLDMMAVETRERMREEARRKLYAQVAGRKVIILLQTHEDAKRNHPVHVALNGKWYNIPRGKPFEIEGEFLEVLDHARVLTIVREVDDLGNPTTKLYDYFSYPYQILRGVDDRALLDAAA